ncbi:hypothetical protein GCM10008961_30770 [Deinococcus knuensis]|uniref:Uncharacterized protein n=1 Tax=Deinococcus knuensis TaxID=1837380 RepID=A0ABQ2ST82_9DEIO|nr:hypothetical protein GCM10008961_30770 [Deinococcus knuensis]
MPAAEAGGGEQILEDGAVLGVRAARRGVHAGAGGVLVHAEGQGDETQGGGGFLVLVEVLAVQVLQQGGAGGLFVGEVADVHGDVGEAGLLRGPPAAFTGDDLEPCAAGAYEQGLQHALLADAVREFREAVRVEVLTRLERSGPQLRGGERDGRDVREG